MLHLEFRCVSRKGTDRQSASKTLTPVVPSPGRRSSTTRTDDGREEMTEDRAELLEILREFAPDGANLRNHRIFADAVKQMRRELNEDIEAAEKDIQTAEEEIASDRLAIAENRRLLKLLDNHRRTGSDPRPRRGGRDSDTDGGGDAPDSRDERRKRRPKPPTPDTDEAIDDLLDDVRTTTRSRKGRS